MRDTDDATAIVAACGGDQKKAAEIVSRHQENRWRQERWLNRKWPEEESADLDQIKKGLTSIRQAIAHLHKPKEIIIYRDRAKVEQPLAKGFMP